MKRAMLSITLLAALAACHRGPDDTAAPDLGGRPGEAVDKTAEDAAQAGSINDAALNSATPNTLAPGDLVNTTDDVGGGAAVDNAPVQR